MQIDNPVARADLVALISLLADPPAQTRDWINGREGWDEWRDEFYDDLEDGYAAISDPSGDANPTDAIGDTLRSQEEAEAIGRLVDLLESVVGDIDTSSTPSREAAKLAAQHPTWPDVVDQARAALAVLKRLDLPAAG